ncbi:MAG TPA: phage holin family protein [Gaiellaceae bacterium]
MYDRPIDQVRALLFSWLANAITLLVVIAVLDDVTIGSVGDLLVAALLFGILNTLLKPVLRLITLPLAVITLRLAWFGVSMLMLLLTALIVDSFDIHGFWALVWATLIVWVVNLVLDIAPGPWRGTRRD